MKQFQYTHLLHNIDRRLNLMKLLRFKEIKNCIPGQVMENRVTQHVIQKYERIYF